MVRASRKGGALFGENGKKGMWPLALSGKLQACWVSYFGERRGRRSSFTRAGGAPVDRRSFM